MSNIRAVTLQGTPAANNLSERDFQKQVIDLAKHLGWRVHAERAAMTKKGWVTPIQGDAGFPDLVLVRPPRIIFAELKTEQGRATSEQWEWIDALDMCPRVEWDIWKPSMLQFIAKKLT